MTQTKFAENLHDESSRTISQSEEWKVDANEVCGKPPRRKFPHERRIMKIGYVVLYVTDPSASLNFWKEKFGMVEKGSKQAGPFSIVQIGFADQNFSFELVPLELMQNNPAGLNLGTPSIAFHVTNVEETRNELLAKGVHCTEIADHGGINSFAFSDNENRFFAVLKG